MGTVGLRSEEISDTSKEGCSPLRRPPTSPPQKTEGYGNHPHSPRGQSRGGAGQLFQLQTGSSHPSNEPWGRGASSGTRSCSPTASPGALQLLPKFGVCCGPLRVLPSPPCQHLSTPILEPVRAGIMHLSCHTLPHHPCKNQSMQNITNRRSAGGQRRILSGLQLGYGPLPPSLSLAAFAVLPLQTDSPASSSACKGPSRDSRQMPPPTSLSPKDAARAA